MRVLVVLLGLFISFWTQITFASDDLSLTHTPTIVGETLFIKGKIDSHLYDYLSYEAAKLEAVKYISLNSYGGSHMWAKEIGRKIQEMGKITVISEGHVCASACVYIFGSGTERWMSPKTWIGIHGARLGNGYTVNFIGKCFDVDGDVATLNESKEGCNEFLEYWYQIVYNETRQAFLLIESAGVSSMLFEHYIQLPDDPQWFMRANILKTEDWVVSPEQALEFNLATKITD